ncbi:MAG: hypothetical protein ACFFCZ_13540 [Promethearchaeota archaeon]
MNNVDLEKIEQQTFGESMIDGIAEILMGIILLSVPIIILHPYFVVFLVLFILFGMPVIDAIRERVTYPRIGRVELRTEEEPYDVKRAILTFLLFLVGIILVTGTAMFIIDGEILNPYLWYKWSPFLFGLLMFAPSLFLVEKTGKWYYYLFGLFSTVLGFLFSIVDFPDNFLGIFLFFLVLGVIALLIGIVKYIRFIRKYPVIEMEGE